MATSYDSAFNNHAIHAQLSTLTEALDEAGERFTFSGENLDRFTRIRMVVAALAEWLERTDPAFVAIPTLNNLNSYLSDITGQIRSLISTEDFGHLTNASNQLDPILTTWNQLYAPRSTADLRGIRQSVTSFRSTLEAELAHTKDAIEDVDIEAKKKREEIQDELKAVVADLEETKTEVSSQKKRLDDAIAEFQSQFSTSQDENRRAFEQEKTKRDEVVEKQNKDFDKLIKDGLGTVNSTRDEFVKQGKTFVETLKNKEKEIDQILGIVGEKVITNDYITRANSEAKQATVWLTITGGAFALLLFFALLIFWYVVTDETISYPKLVSKLLVTAVLGLIAKWAANQARRHQEEERRNRRLALTLATISPYLKDMSPELQSNIKDRLSERLFGQIESVPPDPVSSEDSFSALETVAKFAKDMGDVFSKK